MDGARVDPAQPTSVVPRRWLILAFCLTASFMTSLDASVVTVALPTIGRSLHASTAQLQWVVSGYALGFGIVPILGGRLGDELGRKRMLLASSAAFLLASFAVGLAPSPQAIDGARIVQGLAAGLINPQISGIVQQLFAPGDRGAAFSLVGVSTSISVASGPALGGGVILLGGTDLGWRLLFFVNVPIGIATLIGCSRLLPRDPPRTERRRLDLLGVALLAASLTGVLFPAVQYDTDHDNRLWLLLVPALLCGLALLRWEVRLARAGGWPLLDLDLFRIRSYTAGLCVAALYFASFSVAPLILALYLQDGLGYSAARSGLIAAAYALGSVISAPVGGRLVGRYGRRLTVAGLSVFGVGLAALMLPVAATSGQSASLVGVLLLAPLVLAGLGGGCVGNPNQALTLEDIDVRGGSTAGGMLQTAQRLGSAIGTGLVTAVFYSLTVHVAAAGSDRRAQYGHAYIVGLACSVGFVLGALFFAIRDSRFHRGR